MKSIPAVLLLLSVSATAVAEQFLFRTPPAIQPASGSDVRLAGASDFNGDGQTDVVMTTGKAIEVVLGGSARFIGSVITPTSAAVTASVVIDFDGDGKLDLVLRDGVLGRESMIVMLGSGDGSFRMATTLQIAAGDGLAVADFNSDSRLDVIVGRSTPSAEVVFYPGVASGGFGAPVSTPSGGEVRSLATGDFNGDGLRDLMLYGSSANVQILQGKGDGTFRFGNAVGAAGSAVAADFNRDGKLDIAVAISGSHQNLVEIDLGNGTGAFERRARIAVARGTSGIADVDLNRDGNVDLIVANSSGTMAVLIGTGDGTFQAPRHYSNGFGGYFITAGDLDGDGFADVMTSGTGVSFIHGRGDGTLDTSSAYLVRSVVDETYPGPAPRGVALVDVNGDTRLDIITTIRGERFVGWSVIVFRNTGDGYDGPLTAFTAGDPAPPSGPPFAAGDVNGDGRVDLVFGGGLTLLGNVDGTFSSVSASTFPGLEAGVLSDINGDGRLDLLGPAGAISIGGGDGKFVSMPSLNALGYVADANADHKLDYFTVDGRVLINDGAGKFTQPGAAVAGANLIAAADLNRDGRADAIAYTHRALSVRLANADGSFGAATVTIVDSGTTTWEPHVADFDGDGAVDLLLGTQLYLGSGDGTFRAYAAARHFPPVMNGGGEAIGDVDGNGTLDLVIANGGGGTVDVLTTRIAPDGLLPVTVSFKATPSPSYTGSEVLLDATVAGSSRLGVVGALRIAEGSRTIAFVKPGDLATKARFLVGTHALTATLSGDEYYAPVAASTTLTTLPAEIAIVVTAENPSAIGKEAHFLLTLNVINGQPSPLTGTVTIREGSVVLASAQLSDFGSGRPLLSATFATAGIHHLTISYSGDAQTAPASVPFEQYVGKVASRGTASASSANARIGDPITLTAVLNCCVTSYTGTVTFTDNGRQIGVATVAEARAALTYAFLSAGLHRIEAFYSGDATWSPLMMTTQVFIATPPKRRTAAR